MILDELTLPFLGQRSYLHGTTLFDALVARVPHATEVSFKISKRIETDRVCLVDNAGPSDEGGSIAATISWREGDRKDQLRVLPLPPSGRLERLAYDEVLVSARCSATGELVRFEGPSPFSFVATLIPLHKRLLAMAVPAASPGQWMFTRLDLVSWPIAGYRTLSLALDRALGGSLARSRINVDGDVRGMIYFSWVQ